MYAEFVAICHGLLVSRETSVSLVHVETDFLEALYLVERGNSFTHTLGVIMEDIKKIIEDNMGLTHFSHF